MFMPNPNEIIIKHNVSHQILKLRASRDVEMPYPVKKRKRIEVIKYFDNPYDDLIVVLDTLEEKQELDVDIIEPIIKEYLKPEQKYDIGGRHFTIYTEPYKEIAIIEWIHCNCLDEHYRRLKKGLKC
jgi:hypothetical protein